LNKYDEEGRNNNTNQEILQAGGIVMEGAVYRNLPEDDRMRVVPKLQVLFLIFFLKKNKNKNKKIN
jgi:hypothetical protein